MFIWTLEAENRHEDHKALYPQAVMRSLLELFPNVTFLSLTPNPDSALLGRKAPLQKIPMELCIEAVLSFRSVFAYAKEICLCASSHDCVSLASNPIWKIYVYTYDGENQGATD